MELPSTEKKIIDPNGLIQSIKDSMSNLIFDPSIGIVITYFYANFKMFDPMTFKQIWAYEEMDL